MEPSDVLLSARDRLREVGWTSETMQDEDGRVCIRGAIMDCLGLMNAVRGEFGPLDETIYILERYCKKVYGATTIGLNDDRLSSEDEAADVLEGAAKWAANGG